MKITVKLIGPLIYTAGFSEKTMAFPGQARVGDILAKSKIEKSRPVIITVNGRAVSFSNPLKNGDRVVISHIYSGG